MYGKLVNAKFIIFYDFTWIYKFIDLRCTKYVLSKSLKKYY